MVKQPSDESYLSFMLRYCLSYAASIFLPLIIGVCVFISGYLSFAWLFVIFTPLIIVSTIFVGTHFVVEANTEYYRAYCQRHGPYWENFDTIFANTLSFEQRYNVFYLPLAVKRQAMLLMDGPS